MTINLNTGMMGYDTGKFPIDKFSDIYIFLFLLFGGILLSIFKLPQILQTQMMQPDVVYPYGL